MSKLDLAKAIAIKENITIPQARAIIESVLEEISQKIAHGERCTLRDFGSIGIRMRPPRKVRNPKTGVVSIRPTSIAYFFQPSQKLNALVEMVQLDASGENPTSTAGNLTPID